MAGTAENKGLNVSRIFLDRTNSKNTGKPFQSELELTNAGYLDRGILYAEKVAPPTLTVGGGARRRIIYQKNPFLDYVGAFTARGGRAVVFEAKSTQDHRLPLARDGGLTVTQWQALWQWHNRGAVAFLLWQQRGQGVTLWTWAMLHAAWESGAKSLLFEHGIRVPSGAGKVLHDFVSVLPPDA